MPVPYNDFMGEGGAGVEVQKPYDPDDEPNPANPGGVSNNQLRFQQDEATRRAATSTQRQGDPTVAARAVAANPAAVAAQRTNIQHAPTDNSLSGIAGRGVKTVGSMVDSTVGKIPLAGAALNMTAGGLYAGGKLFAKGAQVVGNKIAGTSQPAGAGGPADPTRPEFAASTAGGPGAVPGVVPPAETTNAQGPQPGAGAPAAPTAGFGEVRADVSAYDAGTAAIQQAQQVFQSELTRLSGVDPFGNQAAMQKATDRAVAQAAGTAAMARGGAASQAGALRGQQGVQSQLQARGIQDMAQQRTTDMNNAGQQRLAAAGGIMSGAQAIAENEGKKADAYLKASEQNLRAYLGGRELDQREKESLRNLSAEFAKIDQQRYATDVGYRESVNQNLTAMYQSDNALQGIRYATDAGENLSDDEWLMGIMGAGAGIAGGMVKSDRRSKYAIRAPKMAELKEFLAAAPGSHYRYKSPNAPGQREGDNYGPMAQDLQRSKIGRTVVVEKADGLYVDTNRLALAHHGALAHLSARLEKLSARIDKKARK